MKRYFFDLRDGDELTVHEEGVELPNVEAAEAGAAGSLGDMARDFIRARTSHTLMIYVRDDSRPVASASLVWQLRKH
jgi:endonuclease YncB( thermonuclease family)